MNKYLKITVGVQILDSMKRFGSGKLCFHSRFTTWTRIV